MVDATVEGGVAEGGGVEFEEEGEDEGLVDVDCYLELLVCRG